MKKLLIILLVLGFSSTAFAQGVKQKNRVYKLGTLIDNIASNAAASARTFTIGSGGTVDLSYGRTELLDFDKLILRIFYDYTAAAGTITVTCLEGETIATAVYEITVCKPLATGVCSVVIGAGVFTTASLSADTWYRVVLGLQSSQELTCTYAHSAPAAGEKVTIVGFLLKDK